MDRTFENIAGMAEGPNRTAAIAEWIQGLYPPEDVPILVGGSAVELYTGGAYTTVDLDFVGHVPPLTSRALVEVGFEKHGKNWIHEGAQLFLEFPSSSLGGDEREAILTVDRFRIQIVSPEDLLVDRLAAWKYWESPIDGVNSFLLYRAQYDFLDEEHLENRSKTEDVVDVLAAVRTLYQKFPGDLPVEKVLEKWSLKIK